MRDNSKRAQKLEEKERIRQRMRGQIHFDNYEYIPEKKPIDYYDNDAAQRVGIYVRVSTDDIRQTTSYELQKNYYEDFVTQHPNWTLVDIYADEGISGTSLAHRDAFNRMIADAKAGKIDLIITKSVSRFARNTVDTLVNIRKLKDAGCECFFEEQGIWTFDSTGELMITMLSSIAQEEARNISENVTWGHRKRFEDGKILMSYKHFLSL